jgi:hypothetical protein
MVTSFMKNWIFFFLLLVSQLGFAKVQTLRKLTSKGVLEIQINSAKALSNDETDPAKTLSAIQVSRKVRSFEKSRWRHLGQKENLRIVVLGDSGCRLKEGRHGDEFQNCQDPQQWPFPQVMKQVARERADVIMHLGDYHYREQCSKGKPCEKMSRAIGYGWSPWLKDFFEPAAPTFPLAPWLLVRGNHEDCKRAYQGYFHLLANEDLSDHCSGYEEPDIIRLKDLVIVNLDTSEVPDAVDPSAENAELWSKRLKEIEAKVDATGVKNVWLVSHKPVYGLVKLGSGLAPVNPNLKKYFDASGLKAKIQLLFAGHVHLSQMIKAKEAPLQFVLGNGGTQLDEIGAITPEELTAMGLESVHTGSAGFGYAVLSRDPKSQTWVAEFKNEWGKLTSKCTLQKGTATCAAR